MLDCIFCKIIKGEITCAKVYEDEKVLAFLDISPVNYGHTLVIPKEHFTNIFDLPEDLLGETMKVVKKLSSVIKDALRADGINLGMNNGQAAGQIVMHAHIHIIPRFKNDDLKLWPGGKYKKGEIEKVARKIRNKIKL